MVTILNMRKKIDIIFCCSLKLSVLVSQFDLTVNKLPKQVLVSCWHLCRWLELSTATSCSFSFSALSSHRGSHTGLIFCLLEHHGYHIYVINSQEHICFLFHSVFISKSVRTFLLRSNLR